MDTLISLSFYLTTPSFIFPSLKDIQFFPLVVVMVNCISIVTIRPFKSWCRLLHPTYSQTNPIQGICPKSLNMAILAKYQNAITTYTEPEKHLHRDTKDSSTYSYIYIWTWWHAPDTWMIHLMPHVSARTGHVAPLQFNNHSTIFFLIFRAHSDSNFLKQTM